MIITELLKDLSEKGIQLWVEGDNLRYRAPQGVLTPTIVDILRHHKAEVIEQLRSAAKSEKSSFQPLSHGQKALWFLYELAPDSVAYNLFATVQISSVIDINKLNLAWQILLERHSILRMVYTSHNGQPVQVLKDTKIDIPLIDAVSWSEDKFNTEILAEADRSFKLEDGPILRLSLYARSPQEDILLLVVHHIAFDFWSFDLLIHEFRILYQEIVQKGQKFSPNCLPPCLSYTDYTNWLQQKLESLEGERLWDYWHSKLAGELPILHLPIDRIRPPVKTYAGANYTVKLDEKLVQQLKALAKAEGTTLYTTLMAVFQVLLHRYTGQEDILVGTPTLGRDRADFERIVGYVTNPVVVRGDLSLNPTFKEFLGRIRQTVLEALSNAAYPFPLLVEKLNVERDPSRSPVFQVSFTFNELRRDVLAPPSEVSELKVETLTMGQRGVSSDLDLMVLNKAGSLVLKWVYNTDLFEATTIERMAGHYQTLLEAIALNPEQRISELPLLTPADRHQLLVEWNNTWAEYPQDRCIHQLFEEQVRLTPDTVAVVWEGEQLTYRELNAKANQLAHYLQRLGVGSEVLVGLCVERSLEMVIGLLGVLKAGGAYVPIDPAYPSERIAYMLDDSQLPVLLIQEKLIAAFPEHQAQVICLDSNWEEISTVSDLSPITSVTPENLAYVIYTSGSTGKPKGVLIAHQGLCNLAQAQIKLFDVQPNSRVLQFASLSFDASIWEIVMALCAGARLCLGTRELLQPGQPLLRLLQQQGITHLTLVPSALAALPNEELPALQNIIVAGEPCPTSLVAQWAKGRRFFNAYGPTESTVCATAAQCFEGMEVLPIGRPIDNTQVYILDRYLQPVPIGVPGELHIASVGLARGYLNRPDLTQEKFIPNPFSHQPSERLYKTGDLARYLPDGNIEYLGRIDNQVKIRGFRIELGEVEAALLQHPAIRETVVVAIENSTDTQQLVAYFVPQTEVSPTVADLRHFLKQQLPDYMIPSAFVTLEHFPLTPNGKVDRRALPAPEIRPELELTFVTPRTPLEEILANIWTEVLGIKQIGINDNFFSLGGHSLLATQIISKIGTSLAVEVPLRHLFEFPTIASLAEQIQILLSNEKPVQRPPILPIQRTTEIPLSFAQARLWFLDQLQPESGFYNIPNILRLNGQLNISALENSINEIILRHEALRTNFTTQNGKPVQIINANLKLELPIIDLKSLSKEAKEIEANRLVTQLANQPFNLQQEPLVRSSLLKLGEQDYIFVLVFHHIIADGWSIEVLERELSTIYTALCNNQTSVLPELPIQYADFAVWQRNWLTGEVFQTQVDYWQQQLKGIPALLELPTDRNTRPAIQTYQGTHQSFQLPVELSEAIISLCKRMGLTPFMFLLTAFQTLLYRLSGQDDIVVGTPVANRHYRETEQLIGFFVNTLALRVTNLSLNPSFEELVIQVREVTLGAYAHQDLPFEELVEALQPERSLSHSPVFQVMFGVENEPISNFSLPALEVSRLIGETNYAKFDLDLLFQNTNDGFMGQWEYNTDLFDGSTITRMTGYLQTLLSEIVANPKTPISELPLLNKTQEHQLLIEWNKTQKYYPQDQCIHQLFEKQVELTPDAVAVVFEAEQITYRELNVKANQLAHYLQTLGVKPEVLVGICVERSLEMIIGLLGILKAGGAYVPLDPAYPKERLAFMLEDSSVPVLLTQQKLVEKLPPNLPRVVCLDSDWEEISFHNQENLSNEVEPENLAYVIYTSGSTGKPKGVLIEHKSLVNYTTVAITEYQIEKSDRILQFSSISFDVSAEEIYTSLASGATLVLRTDTILDYFEGFLQKCQNWEITVMALPTAYWHELTAFLSQKTVVLPPSLRLIIIGGEKALPERLKTWLECVGERVRLVNNYGPTEATVGATICELSVADTTLKELPIGRPLGNVQTYILDGNRQPVPIGIPGELYIGGAGLARGYLNRPDLTDERFIRNPFSDSPTKRLYKTGDRVRYLPDGNIEYLGRIDDQVKVRGFRIELGEIEAALSQHPNLLSVAVVLREDIPSQKSLVAYIVPLQESALTVGDLRHFLKERLPDYMVPSAFVILESLPLTPNGKVDRKLLPAPDLKSLLQKSDFVAPQTPTEKLVASIWAEVLGVEQLSINDNFFELGGHSLLATQIISRIRQAFAIEVRLRDLFEAPTIASLGKVIETALHPVSQEQCANTVSNSLPPLVPVPRERCIPLSFSQEALWSAQQLYPDSSVYNSPIALRFSGTLCPETVEKSINEIIRRHEIMRTSFPIMEGQPVQAITNKLALPLVIVDLQGIPPTLREAEAQRLYAVEVQHKFDLTSSPLIKATLLRLTSQEHWLLITMHHIITDGWSHDIFLQELDTLYYAFLNGLPSPLPEVQLQYADFTLWHRKRFNEEVLQKQLSYWLKKLADSPQTLESAPAKTLCNSTNSKRASFYSIVLPEHFVASILALSRSQGITPFAIIITALNILLFKWSRQTEILILATISNRTTPETEKMLGCFINAMIIRSHLSNEETGITLLKRVQETVNEAINNNDVSLYKILEAIRKVRKLTLSAGITMEAPGLAHLSGWKMLPDPPIQELWDADIPLDFSVSLPTEISNSIYLGAIFSTDLFTKETIEKLFSYCQNILQKLIESPEMKIAKF